MPTLRGCITYRSTFRKLPMFSKQNVKQSITWICATGLEPRSTNCPPSSSVRYIACLIRCTPFCGTNLVMQPTYSMKQWKNYKERSSFLVKWRQIRLPMISSSGLFHKIKNAETIWYKIQLDFSSVVLSNKMLGSEITGYQ